MKLDDLGNFEGYVPRDRIVKPCEPVYHGGKAAVKMYSMLCEKSPRLTNSQINVVRNFVRNELKSDKIDPKIGLGFAILSEDILNINMWGGEFPSLINPNIYSINESAYSIKDFEHQDVVSVGSYCAWEGALVGHESRVWREYMLSGRTNGDKLLYLKNLYSGKIQDVPGSLAGTKLSKLGIMTRTLRGLEEADIRTVGDLLKKTEWNLLAIKNVSSKGIESIKKALAVFDLGIKEK